jgi:hypothetical protein
MPVAQTSYDDRLAQAIVQKATRVLMLAGAPLGHWGELSELGMAPVRPDYEVKELLYGLMFQPLPNLDSLVSTDDVIRQGLQVDPADFPAAKLPDVERAIGTACSWIEDYLREGVGIA